MDDVAPAPAESNLRNLAAQAADVSMALENYEAGGKRNLTKIRYSHDAMIDLIISNPWMHQNELAAYFGYSASWISVVMNTDMFKARLAERRDEVIDPTVKATLEERFKSVIARSLQVLQEKLSKDASAVPDNLALRAAELGAKALGMGGNAPPAPPALPVDHLSNLADRLLALQSRARGQMLPVLEAETVEVKE